MNHTNRMLLTAVVLAYACFCNDALAHPSLPQNSHPHTTANIFYEFDTIEDGNTAHNHADSTPFFGPETYIPPATALGCWDDRNFRFIGNVYLPLFLNGHCHVNLTTLNSPTYYLSANIPAAAKDRIRDAFSEYAGVSVAVPTHALGLSFNETAIQSSADIIVQWFDIPDSENGGITYAPNIPGETTILRFDSSMNSVWDYSQHHSAVPSDKWHFYSVALHEVGHVVGLGHQPAGDIDDLMNPPVGQPIDDNGRQFSALDDDSVYQVARLYTQPISLQQDSYRVYWLPLCFGTSNDYPTLSLALNSGGVSYKVVDGSTGTTLEFCWLIAVETSQ